ncbi:MAG TPA: energy transducer TonB [Bryobacteraceae bacterium]|nr:energy transducer TonB [Bryobacteraceae bacterium]
MFEQSILAEQTTNKPWTLAVSVSAQTALILLIGVMPLIYTDQLTGLTRWTEHLMAPPAPHSPAPPPQELLPRASQQGHASSVTVFRPPSHPERQPIPTANASPVLLEQSGPSVPGSFGDSNNSFVTQLLDQFKPLVKPVPPPPTETKRETRPTAPISVSKGVQEAKLIRKVMPVYPRLALQARIWGTVRLVGIIGKDGTIQNLQVVSGHPMLTQAALDAVRQWIYKPTLLSNEPVEVIAPIEVNFILSR